MSKITAAATAVAVMDASNVKSKVPGQNTSSNSRLLGLTAAAASSSSSTMSSSPGPRVRWRDMEHLVAGISGGVLSTLVLHPLDLVKIRFQVNEGTGVTARPNYTSFIHAVRSIVGSQGFTGLYQGVSANCFGAGMAWGIYFFVYNYVKTQMQAGDQRVTLGATSHVLAASQAGVLSLLVVNPVFVAKTRLCLQYEPRASSIHQKTYYTGLWDALVKIFKQEGVKGFYKGFIPGVFGVSHGVIQFVTYEEMKSLYNKYHDRPILYRLSSLEYITFAAVSKMIAAAATYPYQVVRSRLQDQHTSYINCRDVIVKTWRHEGPQGFYKGLIPNLLRVTPACCVTFLVYETMMGKFAERRELQEKLEADILLNDQKTARLENQEDFQEKKDA